MYIVQVVVHAHIDVCLLSMSIKLRPINSTAASDHMIYYLFIYLLLL